MGVAEQGDRALVLHGVALGTGHELVEQREGVANGSTAGTHDEGQHAGVDGDRLAVAERLHVVEHLGRRHESEGIVVRAGADRADDLLGLGRREDELHVLRRLFHDLEQGVEALRRHHVRLVEDEDLEPVAGGGEHGALAQVARVIHAVVARRVDLDDIERAAAVARELDAAGAHTARGVGGTLGAVEAAGEDAGARGLAAAARGR